MTQNFLFDIPREIEDYLLVLDDFIEREIKPLEAQDDNQRFFDHRREHARTDWDRGGLPREEWEELLMEMRRRADASPSAVLPTPPAADHRDPSPYARAHGGDRKSAGYRPAPRGV